ncbi:MAG: thioredoxin [Anaerolineales bacterium]|nr:thioredoxin [Anaerolineales bacterium]
MSKPINVNDSQFEQVVLQSKLPVIVDFWAPWCAPCKMLSPILEKLSTQYDGKIRVAKVNTDENTEWMTNYGVQGIPTLLFFNDGKLVDRQLGAMPAQLLNHKVEALLNAINI